MTSKNENNNTTNKNKDDSNVVPFTLTYADTGSDVDMEGSGVATVKKEIHVNVNFKCSERTGFVRMHKDVFPLYCIDVGRPDNPEIKDRYYLQLDKADRDKLAVRMTIKKVHFTPCINASGAFGFNPRTVPYGNAAARVSMTTAHEVWEIAQQKWIMVSWNNTAWCYEYEEPLNQSIFPSDEELKEMWPSESFDVMLARGLKTADLLIKSFDDTVIQRALGAIL